LWDDKDFLPGEEVLFIQRPELTVFARAILNSVSEKLMKTLLELILKVMSIMMIFTRLI